MEILSEMPKWSLSIVCLAAILWLTLAAKPLGDTDVPLFPHADKVAHAIMFGGFTLCILLDWSRKHGWQPAPAKVAAIAAGAAIALGIATEVCQQEMGLGRSGDILDLVADTTGALIVASAGTFFKAKWRV